MKKEKLVKKYFPVEPFDMAGLTEWLNAMAAQGLYLVEFKGPDRACFRPGPPDDTVRYGLDAKEVYDIDRERNELYTEMGWEYVTTLKPLYYVYRCADPAAPALHTDPVVQADTLTKVIRRRTWSLVFLLAWIAFVLRDSLFRLFTAPWSWVELLLLKTGPVLIYWALIVGWLVLALFHGLREVLALLRLRRQLRMGFPLEEGRRFPRKIPSTILWRGLTLSLLLALGTVLYSNTAAQRRLTGPEEWTFPHVTLEEALAGQVDGPITPDTPLEAMHYDTFRASLLVPEQYDWSQRVSTRAETKYGVYVHSYRARSPEIASLLVRCLQEDQRKYWRDYEKKHFSLNPAVLELRDFAVLDHPGFDFLAADSWLLEGQDVPRRFYVARNSEQVITFTAIGVEDEARCLDILAGQL